MSAVQSPPFADGLVPVTDGPFAGWLKWGGEEPFEDHVGPFYVRKDERGVVCGFLPQGRNLNGHGHIHGGSLMSFADYALFLIASGEHGLVNGVTVTLNCEFVRGAPPAGLLLARGEVVGGGRSMMFVRGTITHEDTPILSFSGTIKRSPPPSAA